MIRGDGGAGISLERGRPGGNGVRGCQCVDGYLGAGKSWF